MNTRFLDCTRETPIPPLPPCDVCFAQEFFEHVYDPISYMIAFDAALHPGGFLFTNVADHDAEYMHVHPELNRVRAHILDLGYAEILPNQLFRKSG
jgi:hypothetical protein